MKRGKQTGFTLIEVLITLLMLVFVITSISQSLRAGFMLDNEFRTLEEANFQHRQALKLLLEGDPPGTTNPHPGLLEASNVHLRNSGCGGGNPCPTGGGALGRNRLHYVIASTSRVYEVYVLQGELHRRQVVPSVSPATPKILGGGSPLGVRYVLNTQSGNPATAFGTLLLTGNTRAIRLPLSMYIDGNGNRTYDTGERLITVNQMVSLRNARQ